MIPQRLTLKNFLSYREATLDFRGLHTACICGANGAGKSSLLEAISWAVWGQSRAAAEDDLIHLGAAEALVDFVFVSNQHLYRIIRSRHRGQSTTLELQMALPIAAPTTAPTTASTTSIAPAEPEPTPVFRSLTAKGVRATQQRILEHLRLDYDTFINSAYLRQGRADEFMLKRPSDRKQILAELLKLEQYDELAERAKDQARQIKGQVELLERTLESIQERLLQRDAIALERLDLEQLLDQIQTEQQAAAEHLQTLQALQHERHTWQQQLTWQRQQHRLLNQDCQRLQQEFAAAQQQQQDLAALLEQEATIVAGYAHWQALQSQDEQLSARFKTYQTIQTQRQQYQQQQREKATEVQRQIQVLETQLETLAEQEYEIQQVLSRSPEVDAALAQLQQARLQLSQLDQLQVQVSPMSQRRQQLQSQLDRIATRLSARLEELRASAQQLHAQQSRQPKLQQAVLEVSDRIENLEQRRLYQQQLREKGLERRAFMERLQTHQRTYETQLAEVEQKLQLLRRDVVGEGEKTSEEVLEDAIEEAIGEAIVARPSLQSTTRSHPESSLSSLLVAESPSSYALRPSYPPCPLCSRPLDEHHWQLVLEKHQIQQQEILEQLWVIREQLSASEREIQILRQEYRTLEQELEQYAIALERRGQLQEQLQMTTELQEALEQITEEAVEIERSLSLGEFATELQEELHLLDRHLHQLSYDERTHALARGEVDRWRWAELRANDLKQAQRRHAQILQRRPELCAQRMQLQQQLTQLDTETAQGLAAIDQRMAQIGYDPDQHTQLRQALRQSQPWQLHFQDLTRAQQTYPKMQQRVEELRQALQERQQHQHTAQTHIEALTQQLDQLPDCQTQIRQLEQQMQERRSHLDEQITYLGRLQQQQQQLEDLSHQHATLSTDLTTAKRQHRIHQELAQAFGRNGIQTLMIENVLPQLEAETNQILSRLSANQLHVQFVTQRSNRRDQARSKPKAQPSKLIETLDILIADTHGTRPYETYSGGEAFRVNFAIRLALSRLLAQRSGTALQLLIIDEGFGTQDAEGCDRLIAAINAIAPDFACILTVTHVPHLKEAFQARIEVSKTSQGSRLSLSL